MAPRWIKTKEKYPAMFRPHETSEQNLILLSGELEVGSISPGSGQFAGQFAWSMYGTAAQRAPGRTRGTAASIEDAKAALLSAWRQWQSWAGVQDRDQAALSGRSS